MNYEVIKIQLKAVGQQQTKDLLGLEPTNAGQGQKYI